jgi:hypothetical protein
MSMQFNGFHFVLALALGLAVGLSTPVAAQNAQSETIVLVRHGEKPQQGLGQLDCQGLNRALALPAVIKKEFGKPDAIFAPDPAQEVDEHGGHYAYVRPLATIEPTAIAFGMPIDASIGFSNINALKQRLEAADYRTALVIVAWEHAYIVKLARQLMTDNGGDPTSVPDWKGSDFDSIYVIRIARTGGAATAAFEHRHEGLDGQPVSCPGLVPG